MQIRLGSSLNPSEVKWRASIFTSSFTLLLLPPEPTHTQRGKRAKAAEAGSPAPSDEEYLSPQEEAMELGDAPAPSKSVRFKEPPWFQVRWGGGLRIVVKAEAALNLLVDQLSYACVDPCKGGTM